MDYRGIDGVPLPLTVIAVRDVARASSCSVGEGAA